MDEDVLVKELVNSLTFEVEAITTDNVVKFTSTNGTPLNVKVRIRNKDEPRLVQRGLVSIPRLANHATNPEKIRVISSDQTILSFNVYMEAELAKETTSKSRRRGLNFFKFGGCLRTTDDEDDDPYLPSSSNKNANSKTGSKSDSSILENNEIGEGQEKLNFQTSNRVPRNEKRFFGRYKPGGCLDPPFGEDKYPYALPKTQPEIKLKQSFNKVVDIQEYRGTKISDVAPKSPSKASNEPVNIFIKEEVEPKPVLDIYARTGSLDHPVASNYSNSIITYPPELSSSEMIDIDQDARKKNKSKTSTAGSPRLSNEQSPEIYFIPPKDVFRQTEEERKYSRELSSDQIRYYNDDQNRAKNHIFEKDKVSHKELKTITQSTRGSMDKEKIKQTLTDLTLGEEDNLRSKPNDEDKNKVSLLTPTIYQQNESDLTSGLKKIPLNDITTADDENKNIINNMNLQTSLRSDLRKDSNDDTELRKTTSPLNTQKSAKATHITENLHNIPDLAEREQFVKPSPEKPERVFLDKDSLNVNDNVNKDNVGLATLTETLKSKKPTYESNDLHVNEILDSGQSENKYEHTVPVLDTHGSPHFGYLVSDSDKKGEKGDENVVITSPTTIKSHLDPIFNKSNQGLGSQTETLETEKPKLNEFYASDILNNKQRENKHTHSEPPLGIKGSSHLSGLISDLDQKEEKSNEKVVITSPATTEPHFDHAINRKNLEIQSQVETPTTEMPKLDESNDLQISDNIQRESKPRNPKTSESKGLHVREILDNEQSEENYKHSVPQSDTHEPPQFSYLGSDAGKKDEEGKENVAITPLPTTKSNLNRTFDNLKHISTEPQSHQENIYKKISQEAAQMASYTEKENKVMPDLSIKDNAKNLIDVIPFKITDVKIMDELSRKAPALEKSQEQALNGSTLKSNKNSNEVFEHSNVDINAVQNDIIFKGSTVENLDKGTNDNQDFKVIDKDAEGAEMKKDLDTYSVQKPIQDSSNIKTTQKKILPNEISFICEKKSNIIPDAIENDASLQATADRSSNGQDSEIIKTSEKKLNHVESNIDNENKTILVENSAKVNTIPLLKISKSQELNDGVNEMKNTSTPKRNLQEDVNKKISFNPVDPESTSDTQNLKKKFNYPTDSYETKTDISPLQPLIQEPTIHKMSFHSKTPNAQNVEEVIYSTGNIIDLESKKVDNMAKSIDKYSQTNDYEKHKENDELDDRSSLNKMKSFGPDTNAKRFDTNHFENRMEKPTVEKVHLDQFQPKMKSHESVLSENKDFAISSSNSLDSHDNVTLVHDIAKIQEGGVNDRDKDSRILNVTSTEANDVTTDKALLHTINKKPYHDDQDKISSAILRKTSFVGADNSDLRNEEFNVHPLKRNTFTIVESNTSLQKNVEEISTQPNLTTEPSNVESNTKSSPHVKTLQDSQYFDAKNRQLDLDQNKERRDSHSKVLTLDETSPGKLLETNKLDIIKYSVSDIVKADGQPESDSKHVNKVEINSNVTLGEEKLSKVEKMVSVHENNVNKDSFKNQQSGEDALESAQNVILHDTHNGEQALFDEKYEKFTNLSDKYSLKIQEENATSDPESRWNDVLSHTSEPSETGKRISQDSLVLQVDQQPHSQPPTQLDPTANTLDNSLIGVTSSSISHKAAVNSVHTINTKKILPDTKDMTIPVDHEKIYDSGENYTTQPGQVLSTYIDKMDKTFGEPSPIGVSELPSTFVPVDDHYEIISQRKHDAAGETHSIKDTAPLYREKINLGDESISSSDEQTFDTGIQKSYDKDSSDKRTELKTDEEYAEVKDDMRFFPKDIPKEHVEYHPVSKLPYFNYDPSYFDNLETDVNSNNMAHSNEISNQNKSKETFDKDVVYTERHDQIENKLKPILDSSNSIPKTSLPHETVLLNLSFQSFVNENNETIVQTLNPLEDLQRYTNDTVTVVQSLIRHGNEIRIPVNLDSDLTLNFLHKSFNDSRDPSQNNRKQETTSKQQTVNKPEDIFNKNLAVIYETELVPLHKVIKDLTEEVESLSLQQELLREKLRTAKRTNSLRLIPVNKRCGCKKM